MFRIIYFVVKGIWLKMKDDIKIVVDCTVFFSLMVIQVCLVLKNQNVHGTME